MCSTGKITIDLSLSSEISYLTQNQARKQPKVLFLTGLGAVFLVLGLCLSTPLRATESCKMVTELAVKLGCTHLLKDSPGSEKNIDHFSTRSTFGPSECLSGSVLSDKVTTLKKECDSWMAEQKANLKDRYVTGTCQKTCTVCDNGLDRCQYEGVAHYTIKNK